MITATTLHHAEEIQDPGLIAAVALIIESAYLVDGKNWPLSSHDGTGRSGKPSSRPPGRQSCPDAVRKLRAIAREAADKLGQLAQRADNVWMNVQDRDYVDRGITSMGNIDTRTPEEIERTKHSMQIAAAGPSVGRRGPYKRKMRF